MSAADLDAATENSLYRWLEGHLFNRIIGYTIHPLHISLLLLLWISLLVWHNTIFELVGGNYTNGLSAMAASIVLLQQVGYKRELKPDASPAHQSARGVPKPVGGIEEAEALRSQPA